MISHVGLPMGPLRSVHPLNKGSTHTSLIPIFIMAVLTIHQLQQTDDCLFVEALVEDAVVVYPQTLLDPPEVGPGICAASLVVDPDENYTTWNEEDVIRFLEQSYVEWQPLSASDLYCDSDFDSVPF